MKILHVVTLVTPDGAYGGPVRVAANQSVALRELGHDVTIAAATRGYTTPPTDMNGTALQLFPARTLLPGAGYAGLSAPAMVRWFLAHGRDFDAVHVHLARDLVTLPIARIAAARGIPVVLQTHGMIDPTDKALAKPIDLLLTRPVLRRAGTVFHLTATERHDLIAVAGHELNLTELTNGVPDAEPAHADSMEVLYLARLQQRKRPTLFVDAARTLLESGAHARFTLIGPDEGEGQSVRERIDASQCGDLITWEGALSPGLTLERMRRAAVYVLPSVNEPYPMSVLEAMSVGLPVVVTDSCGLATLVAESGSGIVVQDSVEDLTAAIRRLLNNPAERREMGSRARQTVRRTLGMPAVGRSLVAAYRGAAGGSTDTHLENNR